MKFLCSRAELTHWCTRFLPMLGLRVCYLPCSALRLPNLCSQSCDCGGRSLPISSPYPAANMIALTYPAALSPPPYSPDNEKPVGASALNALA